MKLQNTQKRLRSNGCTILCHSKYPACLTLATLHPFHLQRRRGDIHQTICNLSFWPLYFSQTRHVSPFTFLRTLTSISNTSTQRRRIYSRHWQGFEISNWMDIIIDLLVESSHLSVEPKSGRIFHKIFALHSFTDISKSRTTENRVPIIKIWWCPYYFSITFRTFFNDKFSKEWPV